IRSLAMAVYYKARTPSSGSPRAAGPQPRDALRLPPPPPAPAVPPPPRGAVPPRRAGGPPGGPPGPPAPARRPGAGGGPKGGAAEGPAEPGHRLVGREARRYDGRRHQAESGQESP